MEKTIFTEKYRPTSLDEVVGQDHVISVLKGFVKNDKVPHMLFSGPPGTGKTTASIALAHDLFGKEWKKYFLEMNASDDNGIDTVRFKIKDYARVKVIGRDYKLIFMDECDNMSKDAQSALRRIMEMYSEKCRFILSCNFPNKVIDPIKDRCISFRFKTLKEQNMKEMLKNICEKEEINITQSAISLLGTLSNGSMRTALNTLYKFKYGNTKPKQINDEDVYESLCYINDDIIRTLLVAVRKGDQVIVDKYIDDLLFQFSYTPDEIVRALRRLLKTSKVLSKKARLDAVREAGKVSFRVSMGSHADIELKTFGAELIHLYDQSVQ